ncbi:MAG TPA: hypothetical protein PKO15_19140, partial [Fibrobacteria bacterium]|nr:hypothetical protein [Fibrobacteria bacterium]
NEISGSEWLKFGFFSILLRGIKALPLDGPPARRIAGAAIGDRQGRSPPRDRRGPVAGLGEESDDEG